MRHAAILWYRIAMIVGGLGFGLFAERRPFGDSVLAHPIVVFAAAAGLGLLILRVALGRPVPEVLPERALVVGFFLGFAAFLAGNWFVLYILTPR